MAEDKTKFKKVQISEESSEDSDDAEALQAKAAQAQAKKKVDEEALAAAKAKASEHEKANLMGNLPKTAAGFEKDFNALKKDQSALVQYLKKMPLATLEGYFKRTEVPVEILQGVLSALKGAESSEEWTGKMLLSLAKSDNFDMTLMFCEEEELDCVRAIAGRLDGTIAREVKAKYGVE